MAARRSDAHRPAVIDPADYGFVGSFVNHPPADLEGNEVDVENPLWEVPGFEPTTFEEALSAGRSPDRAYPGETDRCDHCGQRVNYAAVYRHGPTGQFVVLGHRCADSVMGYEDRRALRAAGQRDLVAAARKDAGEEAERREKLAEARKLHPAAYEVLDGYEGPNKFISDVAGKLAETGGLTGAQAEKVVEAHARDLERARRREEGEEEPVPGGEAGEKGVVVEGVVVKAQEREDRFAGLWGRQRKLALTVRDDRGFVVWGYAPEALYGLDAPGESRNRDVEKGDRVRFAANLQAKKGDPYFGFFKRPRKAVVVSFREPEEPAVDEEGLVRAAVEDVRLEIREADGVPDAFSARQAVAILDGIVAGDRDGGALAWWRHTGGRDLGRFREAWDAVRRETALGAYRSLSGSGGAADGMRELLGPIADAYVELGGDPEMVGR